MQKNPGKVYIISAASGTGKTSLAKALAESVPNMKVSISHTTRALKAGEKDGESYFFVDVPEFQRMIEKAEFLEYANVFGDYYGTSKAWVEAQINSGASVVLDIDWQGAQQIRQKMDCTSIFLLPPSKAELRRRLETRKRDSAAVIEKRLAVASSEIVHHNEFDYLVINDKFDTALRDLQAIIKAQNLLFERQKVTYSKLISELL